MPALAQALAVMDRLRWRLLRGVLDEEKLLGERGEDLAHRFLQQRGYLVVARNWRPPQSHKEVDLIARHGDIVMFVEVKTRRQEGLFAVERAVDKQKRENLVRAAYSYVRRARIPWDFVRFDVITVLLEPKPVLRHTPDAFHPDRRERTRPAYATEVED